MKKAELFREKFKRGELVAGGHAFMTDSCITELLGYFGCEFVWIDGEHGAFTIEDIKHHIQAAASADTASLVRIRWNDFVRAKPVLEMGPDGIIFPCVCTADEARMAMAACMYPPKGIRGFGPRRANQYGAIGTETYVRNVDNEMLRIIQIEHKTAVENLDAILSVEGIDLVVVGPCDLSSSYGLLGQTHCAKMESVQDEIAEKCLKAGVPFGVSIGPDDPAAIENWIRRGIVFLGCGDDMTYIGMGCRQTRKTVQELMAKYRGGNR